MSTPASPTTEGLRVIELRAENVKRLTAAQVRPDGGLVTVSGVNGSGKTSLIDAIMYGLGGKGVRPSHPVRDGADKAEIELNIGDYTIRRVIRDGKPDLLDVRARNGAKYSSPQSLLDSLVGDLTFDPLDFSRRRPTEQAEILKQIAGLDVSDLDAKHEEAFEHRGDAARCVRKLESRISAIPDDPGAPTEETDAAKLRAELTEAIRAHEQRDSMVQRSSQIDQRIAELTQQMESLQRDRDAAAADVAACHATVAAFGEPDDISATLRDLDAQNARARKSAERRDLLAKLDTARADQTEKDQQVKAARAEKAARIAASDMPLPGLSLGDGEVLVNGIPLAQASQAERLRVAAAIGMALNPKIRVLLIRDGALLDQRGLAALTTLAEERGFQVWVERVAEPGEGVGIVIEDGQVSEQEDVPW